MVGNPGLIVSLVDARGDSRRLVSRKRLGHLDLLPGLLAGTRSLLGLREEGLNPSLVNEVDGATKDASQEEIQEDAAKSKVSKLARLQHFIQSCTYI